MNRDELYLAAFLHDIGKFTERTKDQQVDEEFKIGEKGHPKYSAQLISVLRKNLNFFRSFSDEIIEAVLYHHNPKNKIHQILQIADWLSSSERLEDKKNNDIYYRTPLTSIFSRLFADKYSNRTYDLGELSFKNIFPVNDSLVNEFVYRKVVNDFLKELEAVTNETQLYFLLEKYLWTVPAQTSRHIPDISLFDHLKTTAAIALCLYDQFKRGYFKEDDFMVKDKSDKKHFILINGDISGIQDFIFSIPSKGAAKSLKGRSVYIELISDIIIRYILDKLNLKEANLLYSGGGSFYILAPESSKDDFTRIRMEILHKLLFAHSGELYVAIDYICLSPSDFKDFSSQWGLIKNKVNKLKKHKWSELDLRNNFQDIFGPLDNGSEANIHCSICGNSGEKQILLEEENEGKICSLCNSFIDLTNKLKEAKYYMVYREDNINNNRKIKGYNNVLQLFGYSVSFNKNRDDIDESSNMELYLLNSTQFLSTACTGYRFGAYNLPRKTQPKENLDEIEYVQAEFKDLAQKSLGDNKLGYLKLDVDNLGLIFNKGLENNRSISRMTSLSRMFALYFEGYINNLIEEKGWKDNLYTVYSGGDDTFIVGSWNVILDFAAEFYTNFRKYTCYNPKVTFSAGLGIFPYNFPLIRAVNIAENALEAAKHFINNGQEVPLKNCVSLFGEIFNWDEFSKIKELKDLLVKIVMSAKGDEGYGRAVLYKVEKSTRGFKKILLQSGRGFFENVKFWRLAYYLREIKKDYPVKLKEDYAEQLISQYREIVIHNFMCKNEEKKINNIMIIPAAVKWAELETRQIVKEGYINERESK